MADSRYWTKETTTKFIEIYQSYPCLWKIKSREANRDFVVKKIQSFRGSFRKEMKKMQDSKRSGAGTDEIYNPTLWYYDLLLFTIDQELPASSLSNIEDDEEETEQSFQGGSTQEVEECTNQVHTKSSQDVEETLATKSSVSNKRSRISKQNKSQIDFINYCKSQLEKNYELDEFDAASISWAKKLKRMNPTQAIYADMHINQIINKGLLNQLTSTTDQQSSLMSSPLSSYSGASNSSSVQQGPSQMQSSSLTSFYESINL